MSNGTELATYEVKSTSIARREDFEMSVEEIVEQVRKIQKVMGLVMKPDEHYGVIPGTSGKPSLLKPGAEKLLLLFRLDPQYSAVEQRDGNHVTITSTCVLFHIPTGQRRGSGMGSCSTKESKYAYRKSERVCPECKSPAIIKGKAQYGGGWLCWKKKGGCDAKFKDGDKAIESQDTGRVANEDLPDVYNTVLKMANKRSLVAAVLNATAASDIFTQDIEELPPEQRPEPEPERPARGSKSKQAPQTEEPLDPVDAEPYFIAIDEAGDQKTLDTIAMAMAKVDFTSKDIAELRKSWAARRDAIRTGGA